MTYSCKNGFLPVSGDAVRACLPSSKLTGTDLVCNGENRQFFRSVFFSLNLTDACVCEMLNKVANVYFIVVLLIGLQ